MSIFIEQIYAASAIVTSTSTPGSMLMEVICLTISEGECKSIRRLWILIWKRSQVLDPSPHGVLRVVIRRVLVGIRTGPFTCRLLSLAPLIKSSHTIWLLIYKSKIVFNRIILVYILQTSTFFKTLYISACQSNPNTMDFEFLGRSLPGILVAGLLFVKQIFINHH